MSLAALLRDAIEHDDDGDENTILPEAAIARLKEFGERYAAPNPFKVGDLVTPRADGLSKGAGQPHLILEVLDHPIIRAGNPTFWNRMNVRVAYVDADGDLLTLWIEHHDLVPYHAA